MMKRRNHIPLLVSIIAVEAIFIMWQATRSTEIPRQLASQLSTQPAALAIAVPSPFHYQFKVAGTLAEAGSMDTSSSPYFWLNSGGLFYLRDGIGMTVQGELQQLSKWRIAYAQSNPVDTDNGYHPQNILRLVTRSKWNNLSQEVYFKINKDNLSESPNRNASNGVLLFNRYQDSNNLYYTGVRVDGAVVIKKKINGDYHTIAYKKIYPGTYNRQSSPNLLPKQRWMGIKSEVRTNADNTVAIRVYTADQKNGPWQLVLEGVDDGVRYGGAPITTGAYAGIRTDFMDLEFDDYRIANI